MDELSPESKQLLEQFNQGVTPGSTQVEAALSRALTGGPTPPPPTAAGASVASKVVLVAVVGALAAAAWFARPQPTPPRAARATATVEQSPTAPEATPPPEAESPTPEVPKAPAPILVAPSPAPEPAKAERKPVPKPKALPKSKTSIEKEPDALAREMKLMADARRSMKSGQHDKAEKLLRRYDAEFPRGSFAEQAAALRVDALCALDRPDDAQRAVTRFAKRWPNSPNLARIRRGCPDQGN